VLKMLMKYESGLQVTINISTIILDSSLQNSALKKKLGPKKKAVVGKIRSFMMRTFLILAAAKYHLIDPIKKGGMVGA